MISMQFEERKTGHKAFGSIEQVKVERRNHRQTPVSGTPRGRPSLLVLGVPQVRRNQQRLLKEHLLAHPSREEQAASPGTPVAECSRASSARLFTRPVRPHGGLFTYGCVGRLDNYTYRCISET